jgi:RimJ/RimL family protein N-acetyltransferase
MDFAERHAADGGYDAIRLDVFTLNPVATALYERRGYRRAGTVRFRKGEFFCYERPVR